MNGQSVISREAYLEQEEKDAEFAARAVKYRHGSPLPQPQPTPMVPATVEDARRMASRDILLCAANGCLNETMLRIYLDIFAVQVEYHYNQEWKDRLQAFADSLPSPLYARHRDEDRTPTADAPF